MFEVIKNRHFLAIYSSSVPKAEIEKEAEG